MRVLSLHVYPVKGARGIALDRAEVIASGIRHDRRFMVVGRAGRFVTQREQPRMALVDVAIQGGRLALTAGALSANVPLEPPTSKPRRHVRVWEDEVEAVDVGGDGAAFFSEYLGEPCSLVFMPDDVVRPIEEPYARPGDRVGFADAYPLLVASASSLADLNERLVAAGSEPAAMNRFRPNVVIDGGEPYAEEHAPGMIIGALSVRTPKRCARCQVITVDQATAAKGTEPLRTLAKYRSTALRAVGPPAAGPQAEKNSVCFAMNAIPDLAPGAQAVIAVGDGVTFST